MMVKINGTDKNDKAWRLDWDWVFDNWIVWGGLQGSDSNDTIDGKGGDDTVFGWGGDDWLYGGAGSDFVNGGKGNDHLFGGDGNDTLSGAAGDDYMDGGSGFNTLWGDENTGPQGKDTLVSLNGSTGSFLEGGGGNDTYIIDSANDEVWEAAGEGYDRVLFRGDAFKIGRNIAGDDEAFFLSTEIEEIVFDGHKSVGVIVEGSNTANIVRTKDGRDTIVTLAGDDTVYAGGGFDEIDLCEGNDKAYGGDGNDDIRGDSGHDTLYGESGYDKLYGGAGNDVLYGGADEDLLFGDSGDDRLVGGTGDDSLEGGIGNDTYVLDSVGDRIYGEVAGGGYDVIETMVYDTFALKDTKTIYDPDTVFIEGLDYTGSKLATLTGNRLDNTLKALKANGAVIDGADGNDQIHGSGKADTLLGGNGTDSIIGGGGNDIIDGGALADIMTGGEGDDTYRVDASGDKVIELAGQGYDTVQVVIGQYTLADDVERGELVSDKGGKLTGNAIANGLYGSKNASNTLDGKAGSDKLVGGDTLDVLIGGTGADKMFGGLGNDTYYVDDVGDRVFEFGVIGTDKIITSVDYALTEAAGGYVEELVADAVNRNFTLTGNSLANVITGHVFHDQLRGEGGADQIFGGAGNDHIWGDEGDDVITGGAGNDYLYFGPGGGRDRVLGYQDNIDRLIVSGAKAGDLQVKAIETGVEISFAGSDFVVELDGIAAQTITSADFVFV